MKKIILFICIGLLSIVAEAQELTWHTDINKAVEASKKSKKPLMLFFTGSDWCGWCIKLQKEVFTQPEFTKWAKEHVVLVELDFPRRKEVPQNILAQNNKIQQYFSVKGYPTVWFTNASVEDSKISFIPIGSTGYVSGGASKWIDSAKDILNKK